MRGRARVACVAVCRMAAVTRMRRPRSRAADALFTGKPHVDGLGYAFLFRNYRPGLGKWQTADPLGYPDGWNQLAYCMNPISHFDYLGAADVDLFNPSSREHDASTRWNDPNRITVAGHGSESGVFDHRNTENRGVLVTPDDLAAMIRLSSKWDGNRPVELGCCNVGKGDYAQELANILGVPVYAPDCPVWYDPYAEPPKPTYFFPDEINPNESDPDKPGRLIRFIKE